MSQMSGCKHHLIQKLIPWREGVVNVKYAESEMKAWMLSCWSAVKDQQRLILFYLQRILNESCLWPSFTSKMSQDMCEVYFQQRGRKQRDRPSESRRVVASSHFEKAEKVQLCLGMTNRTATYLQHKKKRTWGEHGSHAWIILCIQQKRLKWLKSALVFNHFHHLHFHLSFLDLWPQPLTFRVNNRFYWGLSVQSFPASPSFIRQ